MMKEHAELIHLSSSRRYEERSNLDELLFQILTKQTALGQRHYKPPEGALLKDLASAWDKLERAEHDREVDLRNELHR